MLNFRPEVVIWWTLKMYLWEVVNTLVTFMASFLLYCNASKLVLEILTRQNLGRQFALEFPTPNYGGLVPVPL